MAVALKLGIVQRIGEAVTDNTPNFAERHFTVQEIAELWQVSADTVRRTFAGEPGVLAIGRGRRALLRVPKLVLSRLHTRMSNEKRGQA